MKPNEIPILIACEESQRVCTAFRERGFLAFSCDLEDCTGGHPEWHIKSDVIPLIEGNCNFTTVTGENYAVSEWGLIIAHPPCTRLCSSGQRWCSAYHMGIEYVHKKLQERKDGIEFFMKFVNCKSKRVAIENPMGIMSTEYRKPDCIYNPYDFIGETDSKKTCLWLKGLPVLRGTRAEPLKKEERTESIFKGKFAGKYPRWNSKECARLRSVTPRGVAEAMATQWGNYLLEQLKEE